MKVSDYIVKFLTEKEIKHVFGYPGGMVTHLMDSFSRYEPKIKAHVCYHEQAAAFAACSYAQKSDSIGVAYATSGPGATNILTGVCHAYFDSIPVLFITGQVNSSEAKGEYKVRQRGFQETDIVNMAKGVTKYATYVDSAEKIRYYLEKAYNYAVSGRKGPVLLDIPMNIQRTEIDEAKLDGYSREEESKVPQQFSRLFPLLKEAKRPIIVLGAGLKNLNRETIEKFVQHMEMPVVTSMLAVDLLSSDNPFNFGFIGAYGNRKANFIVAKSDLLLVLGSRLDVRQVGGCRKDFAPNAKIIRVDIDRGELEYFIREGEIDIEADASEMIHYLLEHFSSDKSILDIWNDSCKKIELKLEGLDQTDYNHYVERISDLCPDDITITTDVGQNQVWVAQSFKVKKNQTILFSGGHGAMGYSLPASIGAYYATKKPVVSFNGDGGIQMNIQELAFVKRENLPIKIIVFNNYALGMIRHFQEMYFQKNYVQTVNGSGYDTPNFQKIAEAYDIPYYSCECLEDIKEEFMKRNGPIFLEVKLKENTYVYPKVEFGKPNQDQEPLIDRKLYQELMNL